MHVTMPPEAAHSPVHSPARRGLWLLAYLVLGAGFGVVLVQSEVVSWYRIQEMFRFQSFHLYGIIASAIAVAAVSIQLIKRFDVRTFEGAPIAIPDKTMERGIRYAAGGVLFGMGWAFTGACPGPIFALLGSGIGVMAVTLLSALAGTWVYGLLRDRLPH